MQYVPLGNEMDGCVGPRTPFLAPCLMARRLNYRVLLLLATLCLRPAEVASAVPLVGQIQPPPFKYWTWRNPLPHGDALKDVTVGGGIFLAVGGRIQSSVDGQRWVEETAELTDLLNAVAYGDGLFVAVGESGQALASANGASWTRATTGTAARLNGVAHGEAGSSRSAMRGQSSLQPTGSLGNAGPPARRSSVGRRVALASLWPWATAA